MELTEKQQKTQEILTKVLAAAWENEKFKKELIDSPVETIEQLTGEKLSLTEGVKMVVVDQSEPSTFYLNIPTAPNLEDVELTEEQLELVAGGGWREAIAGAYAGFFAGGFTGALMGGVMGAME